MRAKAVTIKFIGVIVAGVMGYGFCAHAEEEQMAPPEVTTQNSGDSKAAPAPKGGKKKETKINFDDEAIEGELKKPELFYMFQKKQFNFKRLIKLRDDFLPEMRRDADDVRRGRSK